MALRLSIKYILFRIGKYYHSMMPLFRQERCTPWAPIWCHADFTSCERQHHLAQHDILSSVEHGSKQPQGADIKVPDASSNYEVFISIGMKKIYTNGYAWSWILL